MARAPAKRKTTAKKAETAESEGKEVLGQALADRLSKFGRPTYFQLWVVGDTPIIVHAWSQKAKLEMLAKQVKAISVGREARDPRQDFLDSLYKMPPGPGGKDQGYGFPAMAFKKAIESVAHVDKGIAKTTIRSQLWIEGQMIRTYTAHEDAICDMPVIKLIAGEPEMREDMVRIGAGLKKTASLAYRAQFTRWAVVIEGRINTTIVPEAALRFLIDEAGFSCGVGDWRNEKSGMFGAFHVALPEEEAEWEKFAAGKGPLPQYRKKKELA